MKTDIVMWTSIGVVVVLVSVILIIGIGNTRQNRYCGKVVDTYITTAGYKVNPTRHVVFYSDSLKRNIDVRVTANQYVNTKNGQQICFDLNKMQLEE